MEILLFPASAGTQRCSVWCVQYCNSLWLLVDPQKGVTKGESRCQYKAVSLHSGLKSHQGLRPEPVLKVYVTAWLRVDAFVSPSLQKLPALVNLRNGSDRKSIWFLSLPPTAAAMRQKKRKSLLCWGWPAHSLEWFGAKTSLCLVIFPINCQRPVWLLQAFHLCNVLWQFLNSVLWEEFLFCLVLPGSYLFVYLLSPGSWIKRTLFSILWITWKVFIVFALCNLLFPGQRILMYLVVPPIEAILCFLHFGAFLCLFFPSILLIFCSVGLKWYSKCLPAKYVNPLWHNEVLAILWY